MKKSLLLLLFGIYAFTAKAQLSGSKTIPGDYATIKDAVSALNTNGVGAGGVTFNVVAGHAETSADSIYLTATGTASNPIVFIRSGMGANPVVTRSGTGLLTTTTLGAGGDAVIIVEGSDYVTFDGIDVAASDMGIEYGYLLRKANITDGCKNVTIKNATVTMTKGTNDNIIGIYLSNNHKAQSLASATGLTGITDVSGRNENIVITGNMVQNVFCGIMVRGFSSPTPYAYYDQNITIGTAGAGNIIQNYGGNAASTCYGIYGIYANNLNIGYNTINNTAGGGAVHTASLSGITLSTGTNSNVDIHHNNITLEAVSTTACYAINNSMGGTTTSFPNYVSINDNIITGCSFTGATTGASYLLYQNAAGYRAYIFNNNISSNTSGPSTSGTLYCLYQSGGVVSDNQIYSNRITDITKATGTSGDIYCIYNSPAATANGEIYGNDISGITNHATATGGTIYGIYQSTGLTTNIYKNSISNLLSSQASATVFGINITGGTTNNVYNNFIYDLQAPEATTATTVDAIRGISMTGTTANTTRNIYFNTIFLNASSTGANFFTSGIFSTISTTATTAALNMYNNIVVNLSTPTGTGKSAAFRRSAATASANYVAGNNNLFYAGTPSADKVIFYDGTNFDQTLAAFKTRVSPKEALSITENPPFISSTAPYNLKISTSVGTFIESGGVTISGITDDFDGDTRQTAPGKPDIGADEFNGALPNAPLISYTPLTNSGSTANRTVTNIVITDADEGVNTSPGTKPRLYYKRSIDANTFNDNTPATNGWKYVEASNASSPFSFTIDYALLNGGTGIAIGQVVQYFVVAQDLAAIVHVGVNSGSFASAPSSVSLTAAAFPITGIINSYNVLSFGGSINVGTGETYTTLTNNGGLFAALNSGALSSSLTVNITSDLVEDGTNALNQLAEDGAGGFTVTIQPTGGVARTVSGTHATALLRLSGADRVSINGLNSGGNSLTIRNTSTTTGAVVAFTNDATSNTIANCTIEGGNTSTTSGLVLFGTAASSGNSNNTINNSYIRDRSDITGVPINAFYSSTTVGNNTSNTIAGNNIFNFKTNGISLTANGTGNGWAITNNHFYNNLATSPTTLQNAILIDTGAAHNISGNFIGGNAPNATGVWLNTGAVAVQGISITGGIANINNNTIANITCNNTNTGTRIKGVSLTSLNDGITVTNNKIFNLLSSSAITSYTAGSQPVVGIYTFPLAVYEEATISGNEIYSLSAENTAALTTTNVAAGMLLNNFSGQCFNNKIYDIKNKGTGITAGQPPVACGIYSRFMSEGYVYNNLITVGTGENTNTQFCGVVVVGNSGGSNYYYYNNTIVVEGSAGGALSSYTFLRGDNSATSPTGEIFMKNNIFIMARSGGGSINYVVGNQGSGAATFWDSNNNLFYNSANPSSVGLWNATGYDFDGWKTVSSRDQFSVSFDPLLSSYMPTVTTGLAGITLSGLTTDYAGTTRKSPPTMGAYEAVIPGTWKMAAATNDWNTNTNWVSEAGPGTMPVVPAGASPMPTISTSPTVFRLNNYGTVTVTAGNTLQMTENIHNGGTINGTVLLNGSATQSLGGTGTYQNLTINNTAGATVLSSGTLHKVNIKSILTPTAGTLTTNGNIVLKSTSIANTAVVGIVGGSISGTVQVERYIPSTNRAFRLLAPGVTGSTIKVAWQENAASKSSNPNAGYGTHITGSTIDQTNGFDGTVTGNPSMYTFDSSAQAWVPIDSTRAIFADAKRGYRILIRGDRTPSLITNTSAASNIATTLRNKGILATGTQTFTLAPSDAQYTLVGNPYWASVNWSAVTKSNLNSNFWIWDPTMSGTNGRGAYVALSSGDIQPGQAFFVLNNGGAGTLSFAESNKNIGAAFTNTFRNNSTSDGRIIARLYLEGNMAAGSMADIATTEFGKDFRPTIGKEDAPKFGNPDENISFRVNNTDLSINATVLPSGQDTLFMHMASMLSKNYILQIEGQDFANTAGLEAWMMDSYLNTRTKIDLAGTVNIPYIIDNSTASAASNRFFIVFSKQPLLTIVENSFVIGLAPNPAKDFVQVSYAAKAKGNATIRVTSSNGQLVSSFNLGEQQSGQYKMPVNKLTAGVYTVEIVIGEERGTAQLIKQ
jgi:hypothetical protein